MKLWILLLSNLFSLAVGAAACCGGGFAAPAVIAGDEKAQLSGSYGFSEILVDNVDSRGLWRRSADHQKIQNFKIEGAHIFQDRWQAGISLPVIQRTYQGQSFSGLGDLSTSLGYEYLPDWNYNPWRPKGIGFLQLTLPTGKSKMESTNGGLDSRGNGLWALGAGTLLTKIIRVWDVFSSLEIHRSFAKDVDRSLQPLEPGWGGNLGLGFGYNFRDYRLGSSVTWTYEDALSKSSSIERYATAVASLSWMPSEEWSGTFSVNDQTLFGEPINTSLGRGATLQIQKRWGR